ncbi:hypothetical protein FJZ17_03630 [Candidatus Pacearchaeota archaeon]|nr:hypothetical protein [Candidatus Pacearchaeota archaeon]
MNLDNKLIKIKKAQTGTTITWVVAFVLIFFILAIFLAFSAGLAAPKKATEYIKGTFSSDSGRPSYQTFFANSHFYRIIDKKIEYDSNQISLREVLEGYVSKEYDGSFFTKFIIALNNQSFSDTGFIYSTFGVDGETIFFYGSEDCRGTGSSDFYVFTSNRAIKIETSGSMCNHYITGKIGGDNIFLVP